MRITYDPHVDALYITFKEKAATTRRVDEDVALDYDESGSIAGIEVLSASERLGFNPKKPTLTLDQIEEVQAA